MITAATESWSSTQRDATLEIETRCLRAISPAAASTPWKAAQPPAASMKRRYFIRLQSGDRLGLGLAQPFFGEEAAAQRAVGQEPHTALPAKFAQRPCRTPVDQRERHLVGEDGDAVGQRHCQVGGVEIGDADFADQPVVAQLGHLVQRVEPGRMLEAPPVELQQIDPVDAEPRPPLLDAGAHDRGRHLARGRTPFGEGQRAATEPRDGASAAPRRSIRREP